MCLLHFLLFEWTCEAFGILGVEQMIMAVYHLETRLNGLIIAVMHCCLHLLEKLQDMYSKDMHL